MDFYEKALLFCEFPGELLLDKDACGALEE
jgi:hypothetical protein